MMTETRIGRLLPATLHEAIATVLPQRLEFYEHWLDTAVVRRGRMELAPVTAVLGHLRAEGLIYADVMARAGRLAAEWRIDGMWGVTRGALAGLPRPLRARAAIRVAARLVRVVSSASRASGRVRRRTARLTISRSIFCAVREPQAVPLCGFYAALAAEVFARLSIETPARVERCAAVEGGACVIALPLGSAGAAADPARAA